MDIDRSASVSAGSKTGDLVPNTPAVSDPNAPLASPPPAEARPTVSIKSGSHPLIIYSRSSDAPVHRLSTARGRRSRLFHRPWIVEGPHAAKRKRRAKVQSTPPKARKAARPKPIVTTAPLPRGPLVFRPVSALYDRLKRQLRRSGRPRSDQFRGRQASAASGDGENRRHDQPEPSPPTVHWALRTPASVACSVSRSGKDERSGIEPQRHEWVRPIPEWERGRDQSQPPTHRRRIDQRLAEHSRMAHSLRTCRAQPARQSRSRRPGRAS